MARGAGGLVGEIAQSKLGGLEDCWSGTDGWSGTDLWSVDAGLEGARRIVKILRPTLALIDPAHLGGSTRPSRRSTR